MKPEACVLFSGAASGAEAAFGEAAERRGIEEVNFTFDGVIFRISCHSSRLPTPQRLSGFLQEAEFRIRIPERWVACQTG